MKTPLLDGIQKLSGSELYLSLGKGDPLMDERFDDRKESGEIYEPAGAYHYLTQGKYTEPGMYMPPNLIKRLEQIKDTGFNYVSPENVEAYTKAYDETYRPRLITALKNITAPNRVNNWSPKGWFEGMPEEHEKVLDFMRRARGKGFTIGVPR